MNKQSIKLAEAHFRAKTQWIARFTRGGLSTERAHEQEKRIAYLLQPQHYGRFFDYYFGKQGNCSLSDAPSASFHKDAYLALIKKPVITQFRLWFRGSAKSTQTNVGNAFALKCCKQLRFMLLVASSTWRAKLLLADLQAQLEVNERILHDFGSQMKYGHWRDGIFETQDGCYFMALGINQPFRGLRRYANRIDFAVVDDVEDRKCVANKHLIAGRVDKILGDLGAAFHKDRQRLVISNNYITKDGLIAGLLSKLQGKLHVHISKVNLTDSAGKSTWPTYYRATDVARIQKRYDTCTLQREYYNTPMEEGKVFQKTCIRFTEISTPPTFCVGFWDLSYSVKGDYKAFVRVGLCGDHWYILDIFCRQCDFAQAMDWHFTLYSRLRETGCVVYMYYDAMVAQEHVFGPLLRQEAKSRGLSSGLPMPYKRLKTEKYLRIEVTLSEAFFQGHLHISTLLKDKQDTQVALEQLLAFGSGSTVHDDFPDALAAAFQIGEETRARHKSIMDGNCFIKQRDIPLGF